MRSGVLAVRMGGRPNDSEAPGVAYPGPGGGDPRGGGDPDDRHVGRKHGPRRTQPSAARPPAARRSAARHRGRISPAPRAKPQPAARPEHDPAAGPKQRERHRARAHAGSVRAARRPADGHLANCQKPVSRSKLPPGARNTATVEPAGPGPGHPGGHAHLDHRRRQHLPRARTCRSAWSSGPPTRCRTATRRRLQLHRHDTDRLQPDPRVRAGLRRRGRRADPAGDRRAARPDDPNNVTTSFSHTARSRRRATTRPRATCRARSRRSSPRPRTARWASSRSRRRHLRPTSTSSCRTARTPTPRTPRRSSATTRSRARRPPVTSAARPTTTASRSCTRSTSTSCSTSRSPRRR